MAGILAAVLVTGLLIRIPEKSSPEPPAQLVRSSGEAIEFLKSKGEGLGYENALSELTEIHSVTVSGDSYYRLQQNYRGIPVYGRTVVYAADENGSQLLVTQNIQDIPSGLDLNPTARLEDMQYALLEYLAGHPNTLLLYQDLYQNVWSSDSLGDFRTVMVHISNLRKKLDPDHRGIISTVRGAGYIFSDI